MRGCIFLLTAGWLFAAVAGEKVYYHEQNRQEHELAAYSRAVGALPMHPRDGNQVRVWIAGYSSGRMPIRGYILTDKGAYHCKLSYTSKNGEYMVINKGNCSGPRIHPDRLAKAMARLSELARYDNQDRNSASCEILDGWGADIEGIVDGRAFRFSASNPDACDSAKPIDEILDLIQAAYYNKDAD